MRELALFECAECNNGRVRTQGALATADYEFVVRRPFRPPFGTSEQKFRSSKEELPGPGDYDLRGQLFKKELVLVRNNQGEIKVINKPASHAVFLSKTPKLATPCAETVCATTPTQPASRSNAARVYRPKREHFRVPVPKQWPSIPNRRVKKDTGESSSRGDDFSEMASKKGFLRFSQVSSNKPTNEVIKSQSPGPGRYFEAQELQEEKNAAPFLSSNLKDKDIVWQNVHPVPPSAKSLSQTNLDDSFERFMFSNDNPGPGSYNVQRATVKSHNLKVRKSMVPFGYNQARFETKPQQQQLNYRSASRKQLPRRKRPNRTAFASTAKRFPETRQTPDEFGDCQTGQYLNYRIFQRSMKKLVQGYKGNFGFKQARFRPAKPEQGPDPGSYYSPLSPQLLASAAAPSSSFCSRTKRELPGVTLGVSPAQYNIVQEDIGVKLQNYLEAREDLKQVPFCSSEQRWREIEQKEGRQECQGERQDKRPIRRVAGFARVLK